MAKIQVILTTDLAGQGRKGDIVNVSEGYAKNFILKNNKGVLATKEALDKLEKNKKKKEKQKQEEKEQALRTKTQVEGKTLKIEAKIGKNGKIFGSITTKEISKALNEQFGFDIDKKKIEANIKTEGEHIVLLKLATEVKAELKVYVVSK